MLRQGLGIIDEAIGETEAELGYSQSKGLTV